MFQAFQRGATWPSLEHWPKQNNPVIWLRHNGENKHLATHLSVYILDMLVMDLFPIYFTQNHYFCFYFFTLAFYFVPILDYWDKRGVYTCKLSADAGSVLPVLNHLTLCYRSNVASLHCNDWVWPTERQTRIIIKLKELNVAFSVCVFWVCISSLYYDCTHTHTQTDTHTPHSPDLSITDPNPNSKHWFTALFPYPNLSYGADNVGR